MTINQVNQRQQLMHSD